MTKDRNPIQSEVIESLSPLEKQLVKNQMIVETRGKRGNKVAVIFTHSLKEATDLLVEYRANANVDPKNEYLFARANFGSLNNIRGCDAIRQFSKACGATHPEMLTSSKLLIHLGTMTRLLNLKDCELDNLSSFMGHSIAVHNEFYKLPENTLYLAKVSKLLIALERENLSEYKGKCLDEINFELSDYEEDESDNENLNQSNDEISNEIPPQIKNKVTVKKTQRKSEKKASRKKRNVESSSDEDIQETQHQLKKCRKQLIREKWTTEEQNFVDNYFRKFVLLGRVPNINDCKKCIELSKGMLEKKGWKKIKYRVYNSIKKIVDNSFSVYRFFFRIK